MKEKIPAAIIGLLSKILPDYYTHNEIDGLFLTASAPEEIPEGSKPSKVMTWLRAINTQCANPLDILGSIISDFMDVEHYESNFWGAETEEERVKKREIAQTKIIETLSKDGLSYARGGYITKGGSIPTISLQESVKAKGLAAVEIEINRALSNIEKDPMSAVHNAGSVVEASLKAYLDYHNVQYQVETDTLSNLWQKVIEHIGIRPKDLDNKDLKKIASGLYNIVEGTMHLRNKKSSSHGKSAEQLQQSSIRPRHARLAVHAAHTISAYILELTKLEDD